MDTECTNERFLDLVRHILKDGSSLEDYVNQLFKLLDSVVASERCQTDNKTIQKQADDCAVSLWNFAVAKRIGGKLSDALNARIRHVATILALMANPNALEEITLKKQLMMALKSARAWLDAKEPGMAETLLKIADKCLQKVRDLLTTNSTAARDSVGCEMKKTKELELNKDLLKLTCYKAEMEFSQGHHDSAMASVLEAKKILSVCLHEPGYLSMLCYNFGVDSFQHGRYEESVNWLRESFEMGKVQNAVGSKNQARTLRLLANAYMEWDMVNYYQKALNALELANAEHAHPAGLYLKIKLLLQGDSDDKVLQNALNDVMKQSDLNLDLGLDTVKLFFKRNKPTLGFEGLQLMAEKYRNIPDYRKVLLMRLDMLLHCKQVHEAKQLAEDIITEHNKGNTLDEASRKRFHVIVWDQAGKHYESKEFVEALQWYDYSLSIFTSEDKGNQNLSKLHRNRAFCMLNTAEYDKAYKAALEAEKYDPSSPHTHYIKFKIAILQEKQPEAVEALQKMTECKNCPPDSSTAGGQDEVGAAHGLICLAAQLSFEKNDSKLSIIALDNLINTSPDPLQVLTAARCLCRLHLGIMAQTSDDEKWNSATSIVLCLEKAYTKLGLMCKNGQLTELWLQNEAMWFIKIAWNMAIQCTTSMELMREFFLLCSKLTSLCPVDFNALVRQKTCLLMAAAASLQIARQSHCDKGNKESVYLATISYINDCNKVCKRLEEFQLDGEGIKTQDTTTPQLLLLYEFEAYAKLHDPKAEQVLEKALTLPHCEPRTFETMSTLAIESPLYNRALSVRALQIAINKYLQNDPVEYSECSKAFHSLIDISLRSSMSDLADKDEIWIYFTNVTDLIENKAKDAYPEMEILWLMTKAWNCGIHLFSNNQYSEAARWCELALRLLKHLGLPRENYEKHMTSVYGQILVKVEPTKEQVISNVTL